MARSRLGNTQSRVATDGSNGKQRTVWDVIGLVVWCRIGWRPGTGWMTCNLLGGRLQAGWMACNRLDAKYQVGWRIAGWARDSEVARGM